MELFCVLVWVKEMCRQGNSFPNDDVRHLFTLCRTGPGFSSLPAERTEHTHGMLFSNNRKVLFTLRTMLRLSWIQILLAQFYKCSLLLLYKMTRLHDHEPQEAQELPGSRRTLRIARENEITGWQPDSPLCKETSQHEAHFVQLVLFSFARVCSGKIHIF